MIIILSHSEDALTYSVPYRNLENTAGLLQTQKNDANRKKVENQRRRRRRRRKKYKVFRLVSYMQSIHIQVRSKHKNKSEAI